MFAGGGPNTVIPCWSDTVSRMSLQCLSASTGWRHVNAELERTPLTYKERLGQFDREVEELQQAFLKAVEHVRDSPATDESHRERWDEISRRMKGLRTGIAAEDYDKDQLATLATALLDIRDELDQGAPDDLDVSDRLMILLERIRHVVRDALDEHVNGVSNDVGLVMADLERWLPDIPDQTIAGLVGVNRRTLSRWKKLDGPPGANSASSQVLWQSSGTIGTRRASSRGSTAPATISVDAGPRAFSETQTRRTSL